jgi:hypothetical protein
VTVGASDTGCTLTFVSGAYSAAPDCVIQAWNSGAAVGSMNILANALTFTATGTPAGQKYSYHCMGGE